MSTTVNIQLTEQAKALIARMETLPARALTAVAGAMDRENLLTIAHIQRAHLTGVGPFPPEQHKLGVRTNRLRNSVTASSASVEGQRVDSAIGSNVIYAAVHEFGARIHHEARETKVRLRIDARGSLVRQLNHPHLAVFAGRTHKRAKEVSAQVGAYDVEMPERAPFRTGIRERATNYGKSISRAIVQEFAKLT